LKARKAATATATAPTTARILKIVDIVNTLL
jgi:hypothetical protein